LYHAIPQLDELKRHAYCKWNNSFSHATNNCNVLRRQIQLVVNEDRLVFPQMKVDQNPFPAYTHMLELNNPKVLIRPNQTKSTKEKNVIIGEEISELSKPSQEIPVKKSSKLSLKNLTLEGMNRRKAPGLLRPVRPVWKLV